MSNLITDIRIEVFPPAEINKSLQSLCSQHWNTEYTQDKISTITEAVKKIILDSIINIDISTSNHFKGE